MIGIIIICAAVVVYSIVYLLMEKQGREEDYMRNRVNKFSVQNEVDYSRDEELSKPFFERTIRPILDKLSRRVRASGDKRKGNTVQNQKAVESEAKLKLQLRQAGMKMEPDEYSLMKIIIMVGAMVFGVVIGLMTKSPAKNALLFGFLGLYGSFAVLRFQLSSMTSKRKAFVEQQLPDVLDLLSISVEAGLGFEQSIKHIIDNMDGPLVDELNVTYREMSMGRTRREAMSQLAERCGVEEVTTFVSAVVQAGQLGISLKNVLKSQSESMRVTRKNKVQEQAYKMSTKILFPMLLFIFPVIFIVLLGPAVINIIKVFS